MNLLWLRTWLWELISMTISLSCIVCIIAVLLAINGKSLAEWILPISPNTVVSILNTVAKSSMLLVISSCIGQLKWVHFGRQAQPVIDMETFDQASRGPLGSLKLLWCINWRATFCSICAIVTLLSLAMDPFAQEILQYSNGKIEMPHERALLPITQAWQADDAQPLHITTAHVAYSIYTTLLGERYPLNLICPTNNCHWTEYQNLDVCCNCKDVTTATRISTNIEPSGVAGNTTDYILEATYMTPYGLELHATLGRSLISPEVASIAEATTFSLPKIALAAFPSNYSTQLPLSRSEIKDLNLTKPSVFECDFTYCETTHSTIFVDGVLYDHMPQSTILSPNPYHLSCNSLPCQGSKVLGRGSKKYFVNKLNSLTLAQELARFFNQPQTGKLNYQEMWPMTALLWSTDRDIPTSMCKYF